MALQRFRRALDVAPRQLDAEHDAARHPAGRDLRDEVRRRLFDRFGCGTDLSVPAKALAVRGRAWRQRRG